MYRPISHLLGGLTGNQCVGVARGSVPDRVREMTRHGAGGCAAVYDRAGLTGAAIRSVRSRSVMSTTVSIGAISS